MKSSTCKLNDRLLKMEIHFNLKSKFNQISSNIKTLKAYQTIKYDIAFNWSEVKSLYSQGLTVNEVVDHFINCNI
jgi:hypothetical protein